jgi:hypothetical protein
VGQEEKEQQLIINNINLAKELRRENRKNSINKIFNN